MKKTTYTENENEGSSEWQTVLLCVCTIFQNVSLDVDVIYNISKPQAESSSSLPLSATKSVKKSVIGLPNKMVSLFFHTLYIKSK